MSRDQAASNPAAYEKAPRHRRRKRAGLLLGAVAVVIVYVGVLLYYADSVREPPAPPAPNGELLTVEVRPQNIDLPNQSLQTLVTMHPPDNLLDRTQHLRHNLEVTFPLTNQSFVFQEGTRILQENVEFIFPTNTASRYPFDQHDLPIAVTGYVREQGDRVRQVNTHLEVWGDISGWQVSSTTDAARQQVKNIRHADLNSYGLGSMNLSRAGSTVIMALVILAALVMLAVVAFLVSRSTAQLRRYSDVSLAGWFAALLFAVFPLRLNMPGAPPIGAWIDYIVFLWVVVTLMITLTVFIVTWLRFGDPVPPHIVRSLGDRVRRADGPGENS